MKVQEETQAIRIEYELAHPTSKVWRSLTEPELLAKWVMPNDFAPVVGHKFTFKSGMEPTEMWDGIVRSEVLEVEPEKKLSYTWTSKGQIALDTIVTWTLQPTSNGTLLVLEQTGFTRKQKFAYDGALQGWNYMIMQKLPTVLSAGA